MKTLVTLILLLALTCSPKKITHYQGYIYNNEEEPVKNLSVAGRDHSEVESVTNENGFFKIRKPEGWVETFLYVKRNGIKIDSIQVLRSHPEYGPRHYFVNGRDDTLFIKAKN
ncbi:MULTISPECIES: hypothetical protein [Zobellia]|uniref:hypothetical protein n=1 Tax=Zobellia TaxID=112040 RepID=UPI000B532873|nr:MULTISPECIES: hypothetical protein [Zobellia]MBU3024777.1 hypothetical protein [Zobellia galactanivorans]OWW23125.1 hypothetical protein B4Q04_22255 [Zobellia sp. OII3]